MAARRNTANTQSREAEPEKEHTESREAEPEKEPAESRDVESGDEQIQEKPEALIATLPILYLSKQYKAGDLLPLNNQEMVAAWLEAGSAVWQEPGAKQFP